MESAANLPKEPTGCNAVHAVIEPTMPSIVTALLQQALALHGDEVGRTSRPPQRQYACAAISRATS